MDEPTNPLLGSYPSTFAHRDLLAIIHIYIYKVSLTPSMVPEYNMLIIADPASVYIQLKARFVTEHLISTFCLSNKATGVNILTWKFEYAYQCCIQLCVHSSHG